MTKELVRSQSFSVRSYDAASKAVALSEAKFVDEVMKIHDEALQIQRAQGPDRLAASALELTRFDISSELRAPANT